MSKNIKTFVPVAGKFITIILYASRKETRTSLDLGFILEQIAAARDRLAGITAEDFARYAGCASIRLDGGNGTPIAIPIDCGAGNFWDSKTWVYIQAKPVEMVQKLNVTLRSIERWVKWSISVIGATESEQMMEFSPPPAIPGVQAELAQQLQEWLGRDAMMEYDSWSRFHTRCLADRAANGQTSMATVEDTGSGT